VQHVASRCAQLHLQPPPSLFSPCRVGRLFTVNGVGETFEQWSANWHPQQQQQRVATKRVNVALRHLTSECAEVAL